MDLVLEASWWRWESYLENFRVCVFHDTKTKLARSLFVVHSAHSHTNKLVMIVKVDSASYVSSVRINHISYTAAVQNFETSRVVVV